MMNWAARFSNGPTTLYADLSQIGSPRLGTSRSTQLRRRLGAIEGQNPPVSLEILNETLL